MSRESDFKKFEKLAGEKQTPNYYFAGWNDGHCAFEEKLTRAKEVLDKIKWFTNKQPDLKYYVVVDKWIEKALKALED